ncbi:hypothetical protein LXL04_014064 [Taraxacum kok-saghyz]
MHKTGSATLMSVCFNKFEFNNSYTWIEFYHAPSDKDIRMICDMIRSWHVIGRLGGCNSMSMQLSQSTTDKRPIYDDILGSNIEPTTFYNISDLEIQDNVARIWVDTGTSEGLLLGILINAMTQIRHTVWIVELLPPDGVPTTPDFCSFSMVSLQLLSLLAVIALLRCFLNAPIVMPTNFIACFYGLLTLSQGSHFALTSNALKKASIVEASMEIFWSLLNLVEWLVLALLFLGVLYVILLPFLVILGYKFNNRSGSKAISPYNKTGQPSSHRFIWCNM